MMPASDVHDRRNYQRGCRCHECKAAWSEYQRAWREARRSDPAAAHDRVMYLSGCRCDTCRGANATYALERKNRLCATAQPFAHGLLGYGEHRCRCDVCTVAKKAATRDHYLRNQVQFLERAKRRVEWKNRDKRQVTAKDIRRLLARHSHQCAYCGSPDRIELDHVTPLSKGGRHSIGNLVPCCVPCNRSKSDRLLAEWKRR